MDSRILRLLKDAREQLELERARRTSPIAIVGIGCRFAGGASSPDELWQLLLERTDVTSEVPTDRWNADAYYDPDPSVPGRAYTKRGAFLEQVSGFDAKFFGIPPREALAMDPQQRLLLEVAWEALEDAGIPAERIRGTSTGVWVGICSSDYVRKSLLSGDPGDIDAYSTLGNLGSVAVGRISYLLDLRGPNVHIDTACSSSLVAIHQACQSLRSGESEMALVGGVNVMSAPETTVALCKLNALAADGRCKTFDAAADGYGRGEGCGIVVLKRLDDALAAGDHIYATIRGSAVNHDGHSNGLTAPNGLSQEAVISAALADAGVEPGAVDLVETHGTGTLLGDPIEVFALGRAYGRERQDDAPIYLGALKTHLGHLEAAAGVAGLIKVALCLARAEMTAQLHLETPNPKIPWADLPVRLLTKARPWPRSERPRFGAVSSFGMSGTNAHVVLEEAPEPKREPEPAPSPRTAELIVLSAKTPEALESLVTLCAQFGVSRRGAPLGDLAFSLLTTRSLMEHRLALVASSAEGFGAALGRAKNGDGSRARTGELQGKLAWLFTGQGAQQLGMGKQLSEEWPVFRDAVAEVTSLLDPLLDRPLAEVMWAEPHSSQAALLDQTGYTQAALFAFEWALSRLWGSWGIEPDLVLGHSIGEITAALVAGVFSLADAVRLVAARGRSMQALPPGGVMVSIAAPEHEVLPHVARRAATVSIAAINGPTSTVISGAEADVFAIAEEFIARKVVAKRLSVSHAFHSPLMEPMLEAFREVARGVEYRKPRLVVISNVSGAASGSELMTADYWVRHVRAPVRFSDGVRAAHAAGARTFVEIGPRATLLGLVSAAVPHADVLLVPSLRAGRSEPEAVLDALGRWVSKGGSVDGSRVFAAGARRVSLPTYPWQRERFWLAGGSTAVTGVERGADAFRRLNESSTLSAAARAALPEILRALESRPASDPFYVSSWKELGELPAATGSGRWMVVSLDDEPGSADRLSAELRARGAAAETVTLAELAESGPAEQVVCVWTDAGQSPSPVRAASQGLAAIQALAGKGSSCRLWWVTRDVVSIGNTRSSAPSGAAALSGAALWGLGRTVMQEHAELSCTLLDVEAGAALAPILMHEAAATGLERQLAWRGGKRYGLRVLRATSDNSVRARQLRVDGTVLITGGLGGLGRQVAESLARRGVKHLFLTGRRGLAASGAKAAVASLEALGAQVTVATVDVGDRKSLAAALATIPAHLPLRGVVHAAGVLADGLLSTQTPASVAEVMQPKALGAWNLHELTAASDLDLFVTFSSVAGIFGSAGQGAYSAANAFLDALVAWRGARGLAALSIAWGPWAGEGMAATLETAMKQRLARRGIEPFAPGEGVRLFERALERSESQLIVASLNLVEIERHVADLCPSLWQDMIRVEPVRHRVAEALGALPATDRPGYLEAWLAEQCAVSLGMARGTRLDRTRGFFDLGMDSLMVQELRRAIERGLGRRMSASVLFSHPNIEALTRYLLKPLEKMSEDWLLTKQPTTPAAASDSGWHELAPAVPLSGTESAPSDDDEAAIAFINSRFDESDESAG